MKQSRPTGPLYCFKENDLVWLEGTNITTTHPKAKLAPKRHGLFKVLVAYPVNCKLEIPKSWRIHPVFHNALLKPYNETMAHGPNYSRPPPEIIGDKEEHYEVEKILQSRLTPNKKGIQYLVKWLGYPSSENSWEPTANLKNSPDLVAMFHKCYPKMPRPLEARALQVQRHKRGILSQTVTSELAEMARSYRIPVRNVKTTLSPILKPQQGGPQSPLLLPLKTQQNIHGALAQTRRTRPWTCHDAYAHVKPGKGQPQSLTHLMRFPQIPRNSRVAEMTHRSWLTPSDRRSVI